MDVRAIRSSRVYDGRVVNLRVDEVEVKGRRITREVVEHRGAVAIVPILGEREVVLIKQYRHAAGEELIEIPAGTLEPGELPERCAERELREETGFIASRLEKITSFYLAPGYSSELLHLFVAELVGREEHEEELDEDIETIVMPLPEALEMVRRNEIKDAKTIIGLLLVAASSS